MPNAPKTPTRNVRVEDDLWTSALAVAHERGETLSDVVRRGLRSYVKRHTSTPKEKR